MTKVINSHETDYDLLLGDWVNPLTHLLNSDYMDNLKTFIEETYKLYGRTYPKQEDLFNCFTETKFKDLKAVVLGLQPYQNLKSNGLAYGIKTEYSSVKPRFLEDIKTCVNSTYWEEEQWFDDSMKYWAKQGVLMLNTTMTNTEGDRHDMYWRNFTRQVIKVINERCKNIVFIFMQPGNENFEKYIDSEKHCILKNRYVTHIEEYSQIFVETNEYLKKNHVREIVW